MSNEKLGRPTKERMALIKGQATDLLWYGKIETTLDRAKSVRSYTEKILTKAINTYTDTVKVIKKVKDANGNDVNAEVINDGPNKLAARRAIMNKVYDIQEQKKDGEKKGDFLKRTAGIKHPLIEKIFNVHAPKYAKRAEELGQKGGYTRIVKLGARRGDNAEMVIIELV